MREGFAFHCHHDVLVEYVYDYQERVDYINKHKPKGERKLRLRLFKIIPDDRIPEELLEANDAYNKARDAYYKAKNAFNKAGYAYKKSLTVAYTKAWDVYDKADDVYEEMLKTYEPYFDQLHKELCSDCSWDGTTIFKEA